MQLVPPVLRESPALPVLLVPPVLPEPRAHRALLVLLVLPALPVLQVPLALLVRWGPRRQSFMRNVSDSFSADFAELLLVILYVLCNTAVLVCIIKFDLDTLILMDIDCVDKLHQQATG